MKQFINISLLLIAILTILQTKSALSQTEIWKETFEEAEKGYWGGGSDMSGISKWLIDVSACTLDNADDYIKTVSTSGGRMQAQDIDGEAVWSSEDIDISSYSDVEISAKLGETGSSTNNDKYVKIYYIIDGGSETLFTTNGQQVGNFGSVTASQTSLNGNNLKIIVRINNPLSSNRVYFDEIIVNGTVIGNNSDSQLSAGADTEPNNISSTYDTDDNLLQVLDFKFTDAGSGDNMPTIIKELSVTQASLNQISDWQSVIAGAKIFGNDLPGEGIDANINAGNLHFEFSLPISIADGGNETYSLQIFLKSDLSDINDNDTLDFELDCNNIVTDETGSSFAAGNISSGAIEVDIAASKLHFTQLDTMIFTSTDFNLALKATDDNGNLDTDFNQNISLSATVGNITAASGLSQAANQGVVQWSDLQYNEQNVVNITASSTGLANAVSSNIIAVNAVSSINYDFEDANLNGWWYTNDWANSAEEPITGNNSLKHNLKDVKGKSFISHNLKDLSLDSKTLVWRFNLKNGNWDPTTKNRFWFYLLANESNLLSDTVDGYAVGVQLNASGSKDSLTLWKVTDGEADTALLTSNFDWGKNDAIGIKVERSKSGEWSLIYYENTEFSDPQFVGTTTNTDYLFHDCCGLVFKFEGSTDRAGELWLDDLSVILDTKDSQLSAAADTEPNNISSTYDTDDNLLQVLDFKFTDAGSGDNLPTIIKELSVTQASLNQISDWQLVIGGAKIFGNDLPSEGVDANINADNLHFEFSSPISIADGGNETYSLQIFLKSDLSDINDNDTLDFELDCNNIVTDETGSSFAAGNISSGAIEVDITASKLHFTQLDTMIFTSTDFNLALKAIDDNGNLDTDFNQNISLSATVGNITAASGLSQAVNQGIVQWSDLQCGEQGVFNITASSTGLANAVSSNIIAVNAVSSINYDFEDGNLNGWWYTNDWANSAEEPISGNNSLKHNLKDVKGKSCISHNLKDLSLDSKTVVWRFNLKNGNWDPTTKNRFWFYLLANESNLLSDTVDGYAVGVQLNASGSKDSLTLWKVTDGEADTALLTSNFDWGKNDAIGIKVERSKNGEWSLTYYENTEFSDPQFVGTTTNTDYLFHDCCGLVFKFEGSADRAGELWLDDLSVILDTITPNISNIHAHNKNTLVIEFSEILDKTSAENIDNYIITDFAKAKTATLSSDKNSVTLNFDKSFEANKEYSLSVKNIKDISENIIKNTIQNFVYLPFVITNLYVDSKNELIIEFSHKLEKTSAKNLNNFIVNNDIGKPLSIKTISDSTLSIIFKDFEEKLKYTLSVSNIKSKGGMLIKTQDIDFEYYPGNAFDIVINEIMSDVSPAPNVLPNYKYIELYNRSNSFINLSNWKIQLGNKKPKKFKRFVMNPQSYLLLCTSKNEDDFKQYGNVMGIISESQLVASGTQITLTNSEGELIDYINYSEDWYADNNKKSGGWSLERIDTDNFCGAKNNWQASQDYRGGTPGMLNSVNKKNADTTEFKLLYVKLLTPFKIALSFSKNLDNSQALNPNNYLLNNTDKALFVSFSDTSKSSVILQFATQFANGKTNNLTISNLQDFCGNKIKKTNTSFSYILIYPVAAFAEESNFVKITFSEEVDKVTSQSIENYMIDKGMGKPKSAYKHAVNRNEVFLEFANNFKNQSKYKLSIKKVKDLYGNKIKDANLEFVYFVPTYNNLVINEILFNPKPKGVDFVEIYNKAKLPVDLSKMFLARRDDNGKIESKKQLSLTHNMLEPSVFLCVSADTAKTKSDYPAASYDRFLQISALPSYNDDKGNVLLMYGDTIIDEFAYNEKMHFALIANNEGISLERIDPFKPSNDADNWHSAASTAGFATPANKNSQYKLLAQSIDKDIVVEPETFSPNNDGHEDLVFIRYKFPKPGYVANVNIYDSKGRLIKRIAKNELLSNEGEFSWDGLHEDRTRANIGIYIIHFEVFNLDGVVKQTKKTCVLGRLD